MLSSKSIDASVELPLMESFLTLQGEGAHQGRAAYFIRLAGCDVGCVWCDVKESWPADDHPVQRIDKIIEQATSASADIVVITGGEPLIYNLDTLTSRLRKQNLKTHIETSGAYALSGKWDWFCLSPKKFKAPLSECVQAADELKIIVFNKSDFKWAEEYANEVSPDCLLYLQPEWDKRSEMTPLILEYIKDHPKWRLSLQIHKYLGIP